MVHHTITVLTFASMLAHAGLGCCWHHHHAVAAVCATSEQSEQTAETHGHHENRDSSCSKHHFSRCVVDEDHNDQHDGNCPHHGNEPCGEGNCVFAVSLVVKVLTSPQQSPVAGPSDSAASELVVFRTRVHSLDASLAGCPSSMRAQQLTQVWLL